MAELRVRPAHHEAANWAGTTLWKRRCHEHTALHELKSSRNAAWQRAGLPGERNRSGPSLTLPGRERLQELGEAAARIASDRRDAEREKQRLWNAITGHTHSITTPGYVFDFGKRLIQEVFPGDNVRVAVYDRDSGEHDLYGLTALRIGDEMLRGDDVAVAMPNVESLVLRIVSPRPRASVPGTIAQ